MVTSWLFSGGNLESWSSVGFPPGLISYSLCWRTQKQCGWMYHHRNCPLVTWAPYRMPPPTCYALHRNQMWHRTEYGTHCVEIYVSIVSQLLHASLIPVSGRWWCLCSCPDFPWNYGTLLKYWHVILFSCRIFFPFIFVLYWFNFSGFHCCCCFWKRVLLYCSA